MQKSETVKELATALAKAQASVGVAIKDSTNPHFRSKYADLGAVWEACRDALTSQGLSVVQMPIDAGDGRVGLETMLLHTSGEYLSNMVSTRITKDDAQGVGSALTYLRRYSLAAFIGIVADEDDDGNAASQPRQQAQPQRPVAPATPAFDVEAAKARIKNLPAYQATAHGMALAECKTRDDYLHLYNEIKDGVIA